MLKPSYTELMDTLNKNAEDKSNEVTSRYTIVIAAAKRARQLIDGDEPMVASPDGKPVSTAVNELAASKIKIVPKGEGTILDIYKEKPVEEKNETEMKREMLEELEKEKTEGDEDLDMYEEDILDDVSDDDDILDDDDFDDSEDDE